MNKFDVIFLSILAISAVIGVMRGITKEILSLLSWVGAISMAYILFPTTQYLARSKISNPWLADGVTLFAIFIIFLVILTLISHFLTSRVRASALSGIDRSLGTAYGLLRGCALLFIFELIISCVWLRPDHPDFIKSSRFSNFMYKGSDTLYVVLPKSAQDWIRSLQEKRLSERKVPSVEDIKQAGQAVANVAEQVAPVVQAAIDRENKKQISAEELANLKTKEAPENKPVKKGNTKKQDIEMDRLLDQANTE